MKLLKMLVEEGHRFHPLQGKKPMIPNWPDSKPDQQTLESWINQDCNIGWIQELTAALDFDTDQRSTGVEKAREFWKANGPFRCAIQKTPRSGIHLIFKATPGARNAVKVNELYDIRGGGRGYLCFYGFVKGFETTDPKKLDIFRDEWLPKKRTVVSKEITDIRSYLRRVESHQGANGSAGLLRAAALCRRAGLSQAEAMIELLRWNEGPTVNPPWDPEKELARAITRAYEVY